MSAYIRTQGKLLEKPKYIKEYLESVTHKICAVDVPEWRDYFLYIAVVASSRSKDSQTQHGCVITDSNNKILGVGYNSFPRDMPDKLLPNLRPEKYKWMVHAERNALSNCTQRPENGTAYITGPPCLDCAKSLYQEGIKNFICVKGHSTHLKDEEDDIVFEMLINFGNINVEFIEPDFTKILDRIKDFSNE